MREQLVNFNFTITITNSIKCTHICHIQISNKVRVEFEITYHARVHDINITQNVFLILQAHKLTRTECAIREKQCGFRQGRRCMDQVFTVR